MNWLRITNNGLICPEDLMLIGSSTKREQTGKIGMFGSGWKYALAWLIRNDCKPIIYSGTELINIDFVVKMHRTNIVNVITVNDAETSLTTEMGPKWTGWMALREVISNAIDEGGYSITTNWLPQFSGVEDQTVVYIPMNGELSEVMLKYDSYFSFNRKESFKNQYGRLFVKQEPSTLNVYRRGIRCYETKHTSCIDVDFEEIDINEDRLAQTYTIGYRMHDLIEDGIPTSLFKKILEEEKTEWLPQYSMNDKIFENIKELIESGHTFTTETLKKLGGMLFSMPGALTIPSSWYKKLQDLGMVVSPFEVLGGNEQFIRTDAKDLRGTDYHLNGLGFTIELRSGKCESEVFFKNGIGYVKDTTKLDDKSIAAHIIRRMDVNYLVSLMQ